MLSLPRRRHVDICRHTFLTQSQSWKMLKEEQSQRSMQVGESKVDSQFFPGWRCSHVGSTYFSHLHAPLPNLICVPETPWEGNWGQPAYLIDKNENRRAKGVPRLVGWTSKGEAHIDHCGLGSVLIPPICSMLACGKCPGKFCQSARDFTGSLLSWAY